MKREASLSQVDRMLSSFENSIISLSAIVGLTRLWTERNEFPLWGGHEWSEENERDKSARLTSMEMLKEQETSTVSVVFESVCD